MQACPDSLIARLWPPCRGLAGMRTCKQVRRALQTNRTLVVLQSKCVPGEETIQRETVTGDLLLARNEVDLRLKPQRSRGRQIWNSLPDTSDDTVLYGLLAAVPAGVYSRLVRLDLTCCLLLAEGATRLAEVLGMCTLLQQLNLSNNKLAEGVQELARPLKELVRLSHLEVKANQIEDLGAEHLAASLKACPALTHLEMGSNRLSKAAMDSFASQIPSLSSLTYLGLAGNRLFDEGAAVLGSVLTACSGLLSLRAGGNFFGEKGMEALAAGLEQCSSLTRLDMQLQELNTQSAMRVSQALGLCGHVGEVCVSDCSLQASAVEYLVGGWLTSVRSLDLTANDIGDVGATSLARRLSRCRRVESLDLRSAGVGPAGAQQLLSALRSHSGLTALTLDHNRLFDQGGACVSEELQALPSLKRLSLESTGLGDGMVASFACHRERMTHLNLSHNPLRPDGVRELASCLGCLSLLRVLDVSGVDMCDSSAAQLATAAQRWPLLEELHAYGNSIGDEGATSMAQARFSSRLECLDLRDNAIDVQGGRQLVRVFGPDRVLLEGNLLEA